jgi:hypothetical protein
VNTQESRQHLLLSVEVAEEYSLARLLCPFIYARIYITSRIVEDHKGIIEVSSEVGKGTTFVLRFAASK